MLHRRLGLLVEQCFAASRTQHALGHAVVQQRGAGLQFVVDSAFAAEQAALDQRQAELGDALDAADGQAAVVRRCRWPWTPGATPCPGAAP